MKVEFVCTECTNAKLRSLKQPKPKKPLSVLGGFIEMRRRVLKLSQKDIAKDFGFSDPTPVSKWATGAHAPCDAQLMSLARLLDVDLEQLRCMRELDVQLRARATA